MKKTLIIVAIILVAGSVFAQTEVEFADALFFPEDYRDQDIVFSRVFVGDMYDMDMDSLGGRTFFLTIEDDNGNQTDGIGNAFAPVLPRSMARQWAGLGLESWQMIRSNVYGRIREGERWTVFEISKVETLSTSGNVLDVIE